MNNYSFTFNTVKTYPPIANAPMITITIDKEKTSSPSRSSLSNEFFVSKIPKKPNNVV